MFRGGFPSDQVLGSRPTRSSRLRSPPFEARAWRIPCSARWRIRGIRGPRDYNGNTVITLIRRIDQGQRAVVCGLFWDPRVKEFALSSSSRTPYSGDVLAANASDLTVVTMEGRS